MSVIEGRSRDLGGFTVRRVLPSPGRRMVGPFVFFDEMGPADFPPGQGIDVRPHPHIALATATYLFEGAIDHRDSLGTVQTIRPGDVNWMVAGRGIAHSERTPALERAQGHRLHGIQAWIALPAQAQEIAPAFAHHAGATLPRWQDAGGIRITLLAGAWDGRRAPITVESELFYADVVSDSPGRWTVQATPGCERALYVVSGQVSDGRSAYGPGEMVICDDGAPVDLVLHTPGRLMLLGGTPFPERRHLWWNFVSTDPARIEQAKRDWAERRTAVFGTVPGETEFIPLPE